MSISPIVIPPEGYPNFLWHTDRQRYHTLLSYYSGEVLDEPINPDKPAVLKYPLKINLCRTVAATNAYALLGEWDEHVFTWSGEGDAALDFLTDVGKYSSLNGNYVRQMLTFSVLGTAVWGIRVDPSLPTGLRWTVVPPEIFFPVYSTIDDRLLECIVTFQMSAAEAKLLWGYTGSALEVIYQEHWRPDSFEISIDGEVVRRGTPAGGVIPYVRMQRQALAGERMGESVLEDIMGIQDEINLRLADIGDAVVAVTHKKQIVSNLPSGLKGIKENNRYIDLGLGLGRSLPTLHPNESQEVPQGTFDFVKVALDFARHSASTPAVAYGEDEGSQRSGATLTIRMWPLIQSARSNRALIATGLTELATKTLKMANALGETLGTPFVEPAFPPLMPRDRETVVNEVVQLAGVGMISPERAVDILGVPQREQAEEVRKMEELREKEKEQDQQVQNAVETPNQ